MKRWLEAVLMIILISALTSAFIIAGRSQLPTVPLEEGFELRVTKIALDKKTIEPWANLPGKLASFFIPSKFKAQTYTYPSRSLEIHLGKFGFEHGAFIAAKFDDPIVFFPDGSFATGMLLNTRSNVVRVEFSSYPRNKEQIKIQFTEGARKIVLLVPNPQRAEKQEWQPALLPQTNSTGRINVVLQESGDPKAPFHLTSESSTREAQAWTQWNIELHDAYGNWTRLKSNGRRVSGPDSPLMGDCFKFVARGREYISAGMVILAETNRFLRLNPSARAIDLGLEAAFLLGPGTYQFTGTQARSMPVGKIAKTNSLTLTNDALEVRTSLPTILLVRRQNLPFLESMGARLRERKQDERRSEYFHSRNETSATNDAAAVVATLFPLRISSAEPRLEAEIIATHRAVDFFVPVKFSGSGK